MPRETGGAPLPVFFFSSRFVLLKYPTPKKHYHMVTGLPSDFASRFVVVVVCLTLISLDPADVLAHVVLENVLVVLDFARRTQFKFLIPCLLKK